MTWAFISDVTEIALRTTKKKDTSPTRLRQSLLSAQRRFALGSAARNAGDRAGYLKWPAVMGFPSNKNNANG